MNTPNYEIDPNNPRLLEVEAEKEAALAANGQTYNTMVDNSQQYYNDQIQAAKDYEAKQTALQNEQTDFAINKIEQQKEQAKQDYTKEQSASYVDWQKQSNQYGANAEAMASQGMTNTGYSESSQVSMYNTYQNRVATARESYNKAVQNYDNAITEARLQNNALLAEIAYNTLQTQLQLSLEGFQYKNSLLTEQANREMEIKKTYNSFYQDVYDQLYKENALAEEVRQFEQKQIYDAQQAQLDREYDADQARLDRDHDLALLEAKAELEGINPKDFGKTPPGDVIQPVTGEEGNTPAVDDSTAPAEPKTYTGTSGNADIDAYFDGLIQQGMKVEDVIKLIGKERLKGRLTAAEFKALLLKYVPEGADVINTYKVGQ